MFVRSLQSWQWWRWTMCATSSFLLYQLPGKSPHIQRNLCIAVGCTVRKESNRVKNINYIHFLLFQLAITLQSYLMTSGFLEKSLRWREVPLVLTSWNQRGKISLFGHQRRRTSLWKSMAFLQSSQIPLFQSLHDILDLISNSTIQ